MPYKRKDNVLERFWAKVFKDDVTGCKNRHNPPKGERARAAKLTAEDVMQIRKEYKDRSDLIPLAQKYGVIPRNIQFIVNRESWKHIP